MKPLVTIALAFAVSLTATPIVADEELESAVETRQSVLRLVKWNFSPLVGMARGKVDYDAERAQVHAARINQLLLMTPDAFATDTRGYEGETEALDVIWENPQDFNEKMHNAIQASIKLMDGAGDQDQLQGLVGEMGSTCGGCHDDFRVD